MVTQQSQSGILAPVPRAGRYLFFSLAQPQALRDGLSRLARLPVSETRVLGLGLDTLAALGAGAVARVPGMRQLPAMSGPGVQVPSTPFALWCWLRGDDQGDLVNNSRELEQTLAPAFRVERVVDAFRYGRGPSGHGRDLTGYEDGTENPEGEAALSAALVQGRGPGLDGSSFVAVQQWRHDFAAFESMSTQAQDNMMGRRRSDNEELEDAPESAHVKRTAQEGFDPEAFVWRRSMPWAAGHDAGLMFVAFGKSLDAFEAQMRRMAGLDDGITDALFRISQPVTGAYFWCPPVKDGALDLRVPMGQGLFAFSKIA